MNGIVGSLGKAEGSKLVTITPGTLGDSLGKRVGIGVVDGVLLGSVLFIITPGTVGAALVETGITVGLTLFSSVGCKDGVGHDFKHSEMGHSSSGQLSTVKTHRLTSSK